MTESSNNQSELEMLKYKVDVLEEHVKYLSTTLEMLFSLVQALRPANVPVQPNTIPYSPYTPSNPYNPIYQTTTGNPANTSVSWS